MAGSIIVVGGGVSGLTCALALLEAGYRVEVRAERLASETTSAVAAAVWYPPRGPRDPRTDGWLRASFERFTELARDPATGVTLRGGIELFRAPADDTGWRDLLPGFRRARADELPPSFGDGFVADGVPVIEMPLYLAWLAEQVRARGGVILQTRVATLDDALAEAGVVVNCAGLGARELAADPGVHAIRGQVVWLEQSGVDRYVLDEANPAGITYLYPRSNDVVCGGTREAGVETLEPDPPTAEAIVARCVALEPRLAGARVLAHHVGLRPGRAQVRLEPERRARGLVVHDYGHGGSGVSLSWGCAADVAATVAATLPA